ncbi:MAG: NADH-quinone oxidoreductase subunit M [Planctomycetes bacterium]|nr:NADH-quinone oxidoreductase subunit M [Planctomycetota bacterium]
MGDHLLSIFVALPFAAAALVTLIPRANQAAHRFVAGTAIAAAFAFLIAVVFGGFDPSHGGLQFIESVPWIPDFQVRWALGMDGLALVLLLLSALIHFLAVLATQKKIDGSRGYYALLLLLFGGVNGVFLATDLFLFYVFWELMLIPMYFLIGIWGGEQRKRAAGKFILYTLFGSVLMLVGVVAVYLRSGADGVLPTFDIFALQAQALTWAADTGGLFGIDFTTWIFGLFFLAFAVKIPVVPFHTWLPDAHVQASTPVSVILAGVLLKLGAYGMLRIAFPFAPDAFSELAWMVATLGVINVVYGAWVALAQTDFKRLVAYSSVSHMGFFLLGMAGVAMAVEGTAHFEAGPRFNSIAGASFQLITHGVSAALMFLLVGVVYDRAHSRDLNHFGGLGRIMPKFFFIATVGFFSSLGLPLLAGFVPEALVLFWAWPSWPMHVAATAFGLILTAVYLLQAYRSILLGPTRGSCESYRDLAGGELVTMLPLVIASGVLGVAPFLALDLIAATLETILSALPPEVMP